ncbi:unnamed protein product [Brassica oleracea var. botrytis]
MFHPQKKQFRERACCSFALANAGVADGLADYEEDEFDDIGSTTRSGSYKKHKDEHLNFKSFNLRSQMLDDLGGRSHVRRDRDIGPVILPLSVVMVVLGCRRNLLQSLGIIAPSAIDAIASPLSSQRDERPKGSETRRVLSL